MKPSAYQQRIYDWVRTGTGNAVVEAVAGSGKTTTAVSAMGLIPADRRVLFLAFNKAIAEELARRAPAHAECRTLNALGHRTWATFAGRVVLDADKARKTIDATLTPFEAQRFGQAVRRLVSLARSTGVVPDGVSHATGIVADDPKVWSDLMTHHNVELWDGAKPRDEDQAVDLARRVLAAMAANVRVIDFDDQLYLPVVYGIAPPKYDWIFVDEAQDLSPIQQRLVEMAREDGGRIVGIGDTHQCQPPGTMVEMSGQDAVPIESLQNGDSVVSWNRHDRAVYFRNRVGPGITVTSRPFSGNLIVVWADGKRTRCTPEHRWTVKFKKTTSAWVTYLMRSGTLFRVGWCQLFNTGGGFHLGHRTRLEHADAAWILGVHATKREASIAESLVAWRYRMPTMMFRQSVVPATVYSQQTLDDFWSNVGDNSDDAAVCLSAFGRDVRFPFYENDRASTRRAGRTTCAEVRACNLIDDLMMVPSYDGRSGKVAWTVLTTSAEAYFGPVYSLDVPKNQHYIADGLVTHNSIYGFRGADATSMANFARRLDATRLDLSICYRCPASHIRLAQKIVPQIEARPDAPEGEIMDLGAKWSAKDFNHDDLIICRNSAPLVRLAYRILRQKVAVRIMGRDLGAGLVSLIERLKPRDADHLDEKLSAWHRKEVEKLLRKDPEASTERLDDRRDCIMAFREMFPDASPSQLCREIQAIYTERPGVLTLCTVHKSKGLEADRVFILNRELMPSRAARLEWQRGQESNLEYVALTRARRTLGFITIENK